MEQLLQTLRDIGMPMDEIERIRTYYWNDKAGLQQYVMYIRALFDDRHEYLD